MPTEILSSTDNDISAPCNSLEAKSWSCSIPFLVSLKLGKTRHIPSRWYEKAIIIKRKQPAPVWSVIKQLPGEFVRLLYEQSVGFGVKKRQNKLLYDSNR